MHVINHLCYEFFRKCVYIFGRMNMTSNSKEISIYIKPNYPYIVLMLDLIVNHEINKEEDGEARESRKCDELYQTHKDTLPKSLYISYVLYY